ncbi:hypothetical protein ACWCWD_06510 [Streptomyces sp. NPDC001493]
MKIRADIAEMLQAGHSHVEIMRTLHVGPLIVTATRNALNMPAPARGGKPLRPIAETFAERTEPVGGGHLRWTGHVWRDTTPILGRQGKGLSAYRVAFELRHGRRPVGHARPGCGYPQCVAPDHIEDKPMRERLRQQLAAILGGAS